MVNAVWAKDASKILIFYQSGQVLLGAATGHKILAASINQQDKPTFAYVADSRYDFFVVGFEHCIISYNFDASERYKITLQGGEKLASGSLVECKDKEEPKIVTITVSGMLQIYSAVTGVKICQQNIQIYPSELSVSPNC